MKKYSLYSLLTSLALLASTLAYGIPANGADSQGASPKLYKVEIIVFQHITKQAYDSEQWPSIPGTPHPLLRLP